jgi:crotonobetainyl-CoA:carnitine CoA-transferase CaiB-like acyl-CoA transferase
MQSAKQTRQPLSGLRVLEIGIWHAGPGACAILGDLGAEVIKFETRDGDPERFHGAFGKLAGKAPLNKPGWNMLYEFSNRHKKSISVNIRSEEGREILTSLISTADLVVTNMRAAARKRLGIDYESLCRINPRVVNLTVSAFGPKGPMAEWGGFDPLGQAVSGMMYATGSSEPVLLSWIVLDQITAIAASHAAVTALLSRSLHGEGQEVDVSLYSAGIWIQHANLLFKSLAGSLDLEWDRTAVSVLRTTFPCADNEWIVGTNHPPRRGWPQLCAAIEHLELSEDPRFETEDARIENKVELFAILDGIFRTRSREEWLQIMSANDLLFAPVNRLQDVLDDAQARENGYIVEFEHRLLGAVTVPGYPAVFGKTFADTRAEAPDLGEHNRSVLADLGYEEEKIAELERRGVIGTLDCS